MIECHNHNRCINEAISRADLICSKNSISFTDLRKKIFKIILQNHQPVKAYDILGTLQKQETSAKPTTVYRTLDFLLEHGLIHKLQSLNSYTLCTHPLENHKCYFLICDKCHEVKECCDVALHQCVRDVVSKNNFQVNNVTIEISGICEKCSTN